MRERFQNLFYQIKPTGKIPRIVWIFQAILLVSILLYAGMVIQGGLFSTFYAWIAACAISAVTLLVTLFQRRWLLAAVDLAAGILVFLHLFTLPF